MNYTTIEQLLTDDSFMAWFHQTDSASIAQWEAWIAENDTHKMLAGQASALLKALAQGESAKPVEGQVEGIWKGIRKEIRETPSAIGFAPRTESSVQRSLRRLSPDIWGSYIKVAFRNLYRNKVPSFINIFGLSLGMAVSMLIALWIWDEMTYDHYHANYSRIAQVMELGTKDGQKFDNSGAPIPLAAALRKDFPNDFQYISLVNFSELTLANGNNKFTQNGAFLNAQAPDMLSLRMISGTHSALSTPNGIMLSRTTAEKLFGSNDPMGKKVTINNSLVVQVAGVYDDLPTNTSFNGMSFVLNFDYFLANWDWIKPMKDNWNATMMGLIVQLAPNADFQTVNAKIKAEEERYNHHPDIKIDLFLHPMSRWHLYGDFNNGVNTGGLITFVWLFGIIGSFVLLLACINFMNLSTARSERRAKEVGIRKVMGSLRTALIGQFYCESIVMTLLALVLACGMVQLSMHWFNGVSEKNIIIPWLNPGFWLSCLLFSLFTGLVAGSYPAIYLSSFRPVKVLKGTFRVGRLASLPRKVLVVLQFTVSVLLITGTIIIYKQIVYAKDRPVGYTREGLISIRETTPEIYANYHIIRQKVLESGGATELSESQGPITDIWVGDNNFDWSGKSPNANSGFALVAVRHEYGKTVGWKFVDGRDFNPVIKTDSDGIVINESAAKQLAVANPVGMTIYHNKQPMKVLGVIKDMIMGSPFQDLQPSIYMILHEGGNYVNFRLNPALSTHDALAKIQAVLKVYNPGAPFAPLFVDQEYAKKFGDEERIGTLGLFFSILAILISCLGLYGLAAFVAEQKTKEIGIRKVLGATLYQVWQLMSVDFIWLIGIALVIAIPCAYFLMHLWLSHYHYKTSLSWWVFASSGGGAILLTLLTVSHQSIKAGLLNPVKSLRSE